MNSYRLSADAEQDLGDIWAFIAGDNLDNIDTADRIIDRIEDSLYNLADNPLMGPERPDLAANLRQFVVLRRYLILYRPEYSGITVARIIHGSRDLPNLFP